MTEALAPRGSTALANRGDVPAGFENQTHEDYTIPFLTVLQDMSPLVKDGTGDVGDFGNSVTDEVFNGQEGVVFVPALTQHVFVEWKPDRGGFVGIRQLDDPEVVHARANHDFGKFKSTAGNDLIETFYVYGAVANPDGTIEHVVMPFTSTKIGVYKKWMYKARQLQKDTPDGRRPADLFDYAYQLFTVAQSNQKGDFFNVKVKFNGANAAEARIKPGDDLYDSAVKCYAAVTQGVASADYESIDKDDESDGGSAKEREF